MRTHSNIAFTICSNNYLPQACTLRDSFLKHNVKFKFYIVLVDKLSDKVDYSILESTNLILVSDINLIDLNELISKFDIIELNTSIKPSVFKYLSKLNPNANNIFYLDPDLYFYSSMHVAINVLDKGRALVLTPHIISQIPRDNKSPEENTFLNFGLYNLGFVGLNIQNETAIKILDWWEERTLLYGYNDTKRGYFVDQLWMNLIPIFFDDVSILKDLGYNMAPWNLHERFLVDYNDKPILNQNTKLVFYHFSKLSSDEVKVSRVYDRYTLNDFLLLKKLYRDYKLKINDYHYLEYKNIPIAFNLKTENVVKEPRLIKVLKHVKRKIKLLFQF